MTERAAGPGLGARYLTADQISVGVVQNTRDDVTAM